MNLKQIIEASDEKFREIFGDRESAIDFMHARDRKLLEGVRDIVQEKLDLWGSVEALNDVYDLINSALEN